MGFAETFKALSDPVRRDILTLLKEGSMSAGDIAAQFDMTAATISYHLKILKKSGLVCETKEKNYIYYSLNISVVEEVMLWLAELKGESESPGSPHRSACLKMLPSFSHFPQYIHRSGTDSADR